MANQIEDAIQEWAISSGKTLEAARAIPSDQWSFSPAPGFGSFAKQLRHVIMVRRVFAAGFRSGKLDFSLKHSFYTGSLEPGVLLEELAKSREEVRSTLASLSETSLATHGAEYYGESLGFIEHFSAMVCHEALHRGQWMVYAKLGGFADQLKA